jgi:hypothetical protein
MTTKLKLAGFIACAIVLGASQASADIVQVTYTGIITSATGDFSSALVGDAYTATYTFDTSLGITSSSPAQSIAYGGSQFGVASPLLSASFNVGAGALIVTDTTLGPTSAETDGNNNGVFSKQEQYMQYYDGKITNYLMSYFQSNSTDITSSITTPYTYFPVAAGYTALTELYYNGSSVLDGDVLSVTATVGATPIPAALPLFASGLAGLGLLGWRRKRGRAIPIT